MQRGLKWVWISSLPNLVLQCYGWCCTADGHSISSNGKNGHLDELPSMFGGKERAGNISGSVYIFLYPILGNIYTGKLKSLNDVSLRPLDPDLVLVSACAC